jgi:hypothetical protein
MGSCAKLFAVDASTWERLRGIPVPADGGDLCEHAEGVWLPYELDPSAVIAMWRDDMDNDLSRIATGERRGLPAGIDPSPLRPLLGLLSPRPSLPWWVRELWPSGGYAVGLVAPPEVRALRDAIRASGLLLAVAPSLARLDGFLDRAADGGCWILGIEGQS